MSNKIDSSITAAAASAPVRAVDRSRDQAGSAAGRSGSHDKVVLTGEAQSLQALEGRIRSDSGVDSSKVAEVRKALAEGRYQADPAAIAAKLLQTEMSLQ